MCIAQSVGRNGVNDFADVKVVQVLLDLNGAAPQLTTDGLYGTNTQTAIDAFQQSAFATTSPDGRIDSNGTTLGALLAGIPAGLSEIKIAGIMPQAKADTISRYYPALLPSMLAYEINTPLRQAHFLAQIGHESAALRYSEEIASGAAYEGRRDLGNTQPGDGKRFKGRGLIQLTGRANYEAYGAARDRNFTDSDNAAQIASDPELAVDVAGWFWKIHGINALADRDDAQAVTKAINGGYNGLADRLAYLARSKAFLKVA
jgi:putative chitinase